MLDGFGKQCLYSPMSKPIDHRRCVAIAIEACDPPTKAELARRLNVRQQAIQQWEKIPAERVPSVAAVTGLPRWLLRPDLYEKPRLSRREFA